MAKATSLPSEYAIAVSEATAVQWPSVVASLALKHSGAVTLSYAATVDDLIDALRDASPRYLAFVVRPVEATRAFVRAVHRITRGLDLSHPYSDVMWGVVTGRNEASARAMASTSLPLSIRRVVSGSVEGVDLSAFESGVAFDELVEHGCRVKEAGEAGDGRPATLRGDSTFQIARAVEDSATDIVITSGHARETEWNVGYRFKGGQFRPCAASGGLRAFCAALATGPDVYGASSSPTGTAAAEANATAASARPPLTSRAVGGSDNPKVYSAAGNCLMAHINSESCMALAWLSTGVRQMHGYVVPTWYGYAGWGVHRYLFANIGRLSFAEAYFANQQALQQRLAELLGLRGVDVSDADLADKPV